MFRCINCGGEIEFDIKTQKLKCKSCDSLFDPYNYKTGHAEETVENPDGTYPVTVFRCTQCGGELYSTDNSITGFCSYCGTASMLESRLENINKPQMIIPFQITKDDCKTAYLKRVKRNWMIPKELRDPGRLDQFRGIYMPYWVYDMKIDSPFVIQGETSTRRGDYIYTKHYNCKGRLNAEYNGITFDSASEFDDRISDSIAPFKTEDFKYFTPGYLAGYYADTADVGSEVYQKDANEIAVSDSLKKVNSSYTGDKLKNESAVVHGLVGNAQRNIRSSLLPVWFLSYRNKDRVAYAVVNGDTGEVAADMPVNVPAMLISALVPAVLLYFLFDMVFTFMPSTLLMIDMSMAFAVLVIFTINNSNIRISNSRLYDKGYLYKRKMEQSAYPGQQLSGQQMNGQQMNGQQMNGQQAAKKDKKKKKDEFKEEKLTNMTTTAIVMLIIAVVVSAIDFFATESKSLFFPGAVFVASLIFFFIGLSGKYEGKKVLGLILLMTGISVGFIIRFLNLHSDIPYYVVSVLLIVFIVISLISVINQYNILATRPLPQLSRKGGNTGAR